MTYEDEETREAFHLLPTEDQINWLDIENLMHEREHVLHVEDVSDSVVSVRIVRSDVRK